MAKGRFTKLNLGPMTEARHRSVAGSIIIADYIDPVTSQRTLVLERVAVAAKPARRKPNAKPATAADTAAAVANG